LVLVLGPPPPPPNISNVFLLPTVFPDKQIMYKFLTNCQVKRGKLRYHKIGVDARKIEGDKKI